MKLKQHRYEKRCPDQDFTISYCGNSEGWVLILTLQRHFRKYSQ